MNTNVTFQFAPIFAFILGLALVSGCDHGEESSSILDRIDEKETSGTGDSEERGTGFRDLPETTRVAPERAPAFRTLSRTEDLKRYPCSGCHKSAERVKSDRKVNPADRRAHWKQSLDHGSTEDMSCSTCHGREPRNQLQTRAGKAVSFDRPDRVCQTCHGKEVRDWKGGAHSKQYRYWNWSETPVRYNCTTCHDPHDPSFDQRWPATFPRLPDGGKE